MGWWIFAGLVVFCIIAFMILLDESKRYEGCNMSFDPPDKNRFLAVDERDASLRLHHLWQRKLMIDDQKNAIFEEACAIYKVDPDVCCRERDFVQECFLDVNTGMTPGITQIRLDEYRYDLKRERQEN